MKRKNYKLIDLLHKYTKKLQEKTKKSAPQHNAERHLYPLLSPRGESNPSFKDETLAS